MKKGNQPYYLGLDVGTESVGYCVTDPLYQLLKFKGEPMWGVHLFEEANLNAERRSYRTARRRLNRRQQRVKLLQMLFAKEIGEIDPNFFTRIRESMLYPEDTSCGASLFDGLDVNDGGYYEQYPTVHHLIMDLMENREPHDVRMVYLACAWLVAHRGHFLNEISKENIEAIMDIQGVYQDLMDYFGEVKPWVCSDLAAFGDVIKKKTGIRKKCGALSTLLFGTAKAPKAVEGFPYNCKALLEALCGGKISAAELFMNEEYTEVDSFDLGKSDEELAPILAALGDDAELIIRLKALFDWAVLSDILQGEKWISAAKVRTYEQHKEDLANLKHMIKTYVPKKYNEVFRSNSDKLVNYAAYAKGSSSKQEEFCKYIKGVLKNVSPGEEDAEIMADLMTRLENNTLCPRQVHSDNRVIPHQLYWAELKKILQQASGYLPFLKAEEDGISVAKKILSIFEFRVPYYVGPLNPTGSFAWLKRKGTGVIYPWNFDTMVDREASEEAFIRRMTNCCTYLPDADVLPKMSLCYERFQLLNEINPIAVDGKRIPVEWKQKLYQELFMTRRRVTKKAIREYLLSHSVYTREELEKLSGIDDTVKSTLSSHMAFRSLLERGILSVEDAESIIRRRTYTENKARFVLWLEREYPDLSEADRSYIARLKFKDFGRLSYELLCELYGTQTNSTTGEAATILERMWDENVTLMELISDAYTYHRQIAERTAEYYAAHTETLDDRLDEMRISNAVKRSIIRTLDVVGDVVKASGGVPQKIFLEMARGGKPEEKGKRTMSRYAQIQSLYKTVDTEDVRRLSEELQAMGEGAESRLQSDRLFLYYMQLGKCMYTGKRLELSQLSGKLYDIDHIYPQSKVKDDSVLNNKVLVLSTANAEKGDRYPISQAVRREQTPWWKFLKNQGFITEEKYRRLTRHEPFSETEQWGFINRQLVETRQSTKALATILQERYPETKIVYVKAGLVSEFRQEFDMLKSRSVNDLHHAKDAYLNIVVGNVYTERFTRQWFLAHRDTYNQKIKTLFAHPVTGEGHTTLWAGPQDLCKVKKIMQSNHVHLTRYAMCRKGGFFDQQPCKAAKGLVPLKKGLPTEKYGGYNKPAAAFFSLVRYQTKKKTDLMVMPVELMHASEYLADENYREAYAKQMIEGILEQQVQSVSFPMGARKLKIGTIFEMDGGMRLFLTGKANGGKVIGLTMLIPLVVGYPWEKYIKQMERLQEKKKAHPTMVYSRLYDKVNPEDNLKLYELLLQKLKDTVYKKRPANPIETLLKGKDKFVELNVFEQTEVLLQILGICGRAKSANLKEIGGVAQAGGITLSSSVSNWKKNYSDVRILDQSASGLYGTRSENILELL